MITDHDASAVAAGIAKEVRWFGQRIRRDPHSWDIWVFDLGSMRRNFFARSDAVAVHCCLEYEHGIACAVVNG